MSTVKLRKRHEYTIWICMYVWIKYSGVVNHVKVVMYLVLEIFKKITLTWTVGSSQRDLSFQYKLKGSNTFGSRNNQSLLLSGLFPFISSPVVCGLNCCSGSNRWGALFCTSGNQNDFIQWRAIIMVTCLQLFTWVKIQDMSVGGEKPQYYKSVRKTN